MSELASEPSAQQREFASEPSAQRRELAREGPTAPPRSNGELQFTAPWESRAFGMAVALHESGAFEWPSFQQSLITRIAAPGERPYYADWLGALEDVLAVTADVDARAESLSHRHAGHDHAP